MLTIYKASAGSGKTYTLALEYIKTLLGIKLADGSYRLNGAVPPRLANRHRNILAITFTNAATTEMKSRIIREISRLAAHPGGDTPESAYAGPLTAAFGCSRESLRKAAEAALSELLNDYSGFNVSTIDSFFQTVLRTFAREIDHQGDYELALDRLDIIRQSISLMLDRLNYEPDRSHRRLFAWVRSFMLENLGQGKSYNIFDRGGNILSDLASAMDGAMDEKFQNMSQQMARYLADSTLADAFCRKIDEAVGAQRKMAAAAAARFLEAAAAAGVDDSTLNSSVAARARDIASSPETINARTFTLKAVKALVDDGEPLAPADVLKADIRRKLEKSDPATAVAIAEAATDMFRSAWNAFGRCRILTRMAQGTVNLQFIGMVQGILGEFLRENNTMLISDTGELLARIISDAEMPFIYERLGMKLTNLLIDEFQDTSHMQWHNLRPLVANALAEDSDNLIIGDVKQAIYRFRNSDPELLGSVVESRDFPASHTLRGQLPEDNTNHRSSGALVRFNNSLFANMAANLGLSGYEAVAQTPAARLADAPAMVKIVIDHTPPPVEEVYESLAADILRQHSAGYRWSDIMVLVRERRNGVAIITYFMEHHPEIRLLSNEALLLGNSPAVRTIMGMLAMVDRSYAERKPEHSESPEAPGAKPRYATADDITAFNSRFNYLCGQGAAAAEAIITALDSDRGGKSLRGQIEQIRAENPANVVALIEAIVHYRLSDTQKSTEQAYIAALQDLAIDHCNSADPSVGAFVDAYNRNAHRWAIQASADTDAVEVMTIHSSKGLERPCVHIPFADWTTIRDSEIWLPTAGLEDMGDFDPATVPPAVRVTLSRNDVLCRNGISPFADFCNACHKADIQDNVNLAYVAFTRAGRELCVRSGATDMGAFIAAALATEAPQGPLYMPLETTAVTDGDSTRTELTIGAPTVPEAAGIPVPVVPPPSYDVVYRDDAREIISIDDELSETIDTGGEYIPEITDAPDGTQAMLLAARRGNHLHAILAGMERAADLDASVARLRRANIISDSEASEYAALLREAIAGGGSEADSWFDPFAEVFAERSIYNPATGETFRPDRVVRTTAGSLAVIDYKFTSEPRAGHRRQVAEYSRLLRSIENAPVEAFLWYPVLKRIIKVQ